VRMSDELRAYVESVLSTEKKAKVSTGSGASHKLIKMMTGRLMRDEFREKDAEQALVRTYKEDIDEKDMTGTRLTEWYQNAVSDLLLSLAEDEIPMKFMRGASGSHAVKNYSNDHMFLNSLGFPHQEVGEALKSNGQDKQRALRQLMRMLMSGLGLKEIDTESIRVEPGEIKEVLENEVEALQSMYDDGFTLLAPNHWKITLYIDHKDLLPHSLTLHVYIPPDVLYPHDIPLFYFQHPKLSPSMNMRLIQNLLRHIMPIIGDPMTFEIVEWVKDNVEIIMDNSTSLPLKVLNGKWWENLHQKKKAKKKRKRKLIGK